MIEVELKAVVEDLGATRLGVEDAGASLRFTGRLEDRRYDRADRALAAQDNVLRLRVYRADRALARAYVDWKGPTSYEGGYKQREELSTALSDADAFALILERLGYIVTMAIDRQIWQYELDGAVIRFERFPRMDDLVEVEGAPDAIERAIDTLGVARHCFTAERLPSFVRRFEARTGQRAALSDAELAGVVRYRIDDA